MGILTCKKCGGDLTEEGDYYVCPSCGARYTNDGARKYREELRNVLGEAFYEEKQEQLANLRRLLWKKTHEKFSDGDAIKDICCKIQELVPDDVAAEFYYCVSDGRTKRINKFLQTFDMENDPEYVEDFVAYTIKSLRKENVVFLHAFLERAKNVLSSNTYQKLLDELEDEAEEVENGVYNVNLPRTVFVLYSGKDLDKATELVDKLEKYGFSCFLAARNLQHGSNAVADYGPYLKTAIDNCRIVLFVSSENSCDQACDALSFEMKYIKQKDIEGFPAEYKNSSYKDVPMSYKKPRIEYLLGTKRKSADKASEDLVKEFFGTLSYCQTEGAVIERINELLNEEPYLPQPRKEKQKADKSVKFCKTCGAENLASAKFCSACANEEFVATYEEFETLLTQRAAAEAEAKSRKKKQEQEAAAALERQKAKEAAALERQKAKEAAKEEKRQAIEKKLWRWKKQAHKSLNTSLTLILPLLLAAILIVCGIFFENARHWLIGAGILVAYTATFWKLVRIHGGWTWVFLGAQLALTIACIPLYFINDITRTYATSFAASVFVPSVILFFYLRGCTEKVKKNRWSEEEVVVFKYPREVDIAYTFIGIGGVVLDIAIAMWFSGLGRTLTISVGVPAVYGLITCFHGLLVDDSEYWDWTFFWISIALGITSFVFCWISRDFNYFAMGMSLAGGLYVLFKIDIPNLWGWDYSVWSICWGIVFVITVLRMFFGWWFTDYKYKDDVLVGYYGNEEVVYIPEGVTGIEGAFSNAWQGKDSMKEVFLPNSLQTIGANAFYYCNSLTEIRIPDSVTTIGSDAFYNCSSLTEIRIPDGVTTIGIRAFADCDGLTEIRIPDSVTTIGIEAFKECSKLTTVYLGSGLEQIGGSLFYDSSVETIYYNGTQEDWEKIEKVPYKFFGTYEWDSGMGDYELVFLQE